MYIGLFLLIPFLNIIWNNLETKKEHLILLFTLCFCTTLTTFFNTYDFVTPGFWKNPTISTSYNPILPNWWTNIYPIFYYYIGAFIKKYHVKFKSMANVLLLFLTTVIFGSYNYWRNYNRCLVWESYFDWYGFEIVILSVLVFVLLLNLKIDKMPVVLKNIIAKISSLSLNIYLVSQIFDLAFYPILIAKVPNMKLRFNYSLIMVLAVFVCSTCLAQLIDLIGRYINRLLYDVLEKKKKVI